MRRRALMRSVVGVGLVLSCLSSRSAAQAPAGTPPRAVGDATSTPAPVAAPAQAAATTRLPVRRVVLYKNGIGYFEHLGRVSGSQPVTIEFTSAQLNDVLKSLTTLDLSGGRITGISYNSEAPLTQRLGALRLPLDGEATRTGLFEALLGARLEAQSPAGTVTGRLLSVERRTRVQGERAAEIDELVIVTDGA
jgi:hypothetical protein